MGAVRAVALPSSASSGTDCRARGSAKVTATGKPVISDWYKGQVSGKPVVTLGYPGARGRPERRRRARPEHRSVAAADGIRRSALAGRIGHHAARSIRTGARPQRRRRAIHRDDRVAARRRCGGAPPTHYRRTGRRRTDYRARIHSPRPLVPERRHSPHRRARVAFSALDAQRADHRRVGVRADRLSAC